MEQIQKLDSNQIQNLETKIKEISDTYENQDGILKYQYDIFKKLFDLFAKRGMYFIMRKQNDKGKKKDYLFVGDEKYFETGFWKFDKKIVPYNQNFTIAINIVFSKNQTFFIGTSLQSTKEEVEFFENNILKKIHDKIPDFKERGRNFDTLSKKQEGRIAYSTENMTDFSKMEEYITIIDTILSEINGVRKINKEEFIEMFDRRLGYISEINNIKGPINDLELSNNSASPKLNKISELLNRKKQIILYGPPGTGKTYNIKSIIENHSGEDYSILKEEGRVEFITFHQSFSYEEFIEGIKPDLDGDSDEINYKIEDGIFKRISNDAKINIQNYYLIIDEINRGNISKIFGELITLLEVDKRYGEKNQIITRLPYSKKDFYVPSNLFIIATMNTSDKSIVSLDSALRRRFGFKEMLPDYNLEGLNKNIEGINLSKLLQKINNRIDYLIDKDHLIGHSYFLEAENIGDLKLIIYNEILPLLEEYFYGEEEKIRLVLGNKLFEKKNYDDSLFENNNTFENDENNYEINTTLSDDEFINALKNIIEFNEER